MGMNIGCGLAVTALPMLCVYTGMCRWADRVVYMMTLSQMNKIILCINAVIYILYRTCI